MREVIVACVLLLSLTLAVACELHGVKQVEVKPEQIPTDPYEGMDFTQFCSGYTQQDRCNQDSVCIWNLETAKCIPWLDPEGE